MLMVPIEFVGVAQTPAMAPQMLTPPVSLIGAGKNILWMQGQFFEILLLRLCVYEQGAKLPTNAPQLYSIKQAMLIFWMLLALLVQILNVIAVPPLRLFKKCQ